MLFGFAGEAGNRCRRCEPRRLTFGTDMHGRTEDRGVVEGPGEKTDTAGQMTLKEDGAAAGAAEMAIESGGRGVVTGLTFGKAEIGTGVQSGRQ